MAAKFEIRSPKADQYRWVLVSQGRTLATGQAYPRRAMAEKAIVSFRMAATAAPVIDTTVPAAKTATRKTARTAGQAVGKAAAAVQKTERAGAKTVKRAARKVTKAVEAPGPRSRRKR
jgi:uncharacterized protein YegP (UPF0339 family)